MYREGIMPNRVAFDLKKTQKITYGNDGEEKSIISVTQGKIPDCFPKEWKEAIKKGLTPSQESSSGKYSCTCGKHTLHLVEVDSKVWPEDQEVRIRVIEKD
jgi:hypothetical protein